MSKRNFITEAMTNAPSSLPAKHGSFSTGAEQPILEGLQPLKREVRDVLRSGLTPDSPASAAFAAIHKVEVWDDPAMSPEDNDKTFRASNITQSSRSPRYGYKTGQDAQKYDDLQEGEIQDEFAVFDPMLEELDGMNANEAHAFLARNGFKRVEVDEPGQPGYVHSDSHAALYEHPHFAGNMVQLEWDAKSKKVCTGLVLSEMDAADLALMLKEVGEGYGLTKELVLATVMATAAQECDGTTIEDVVCAIATGMIEEMLEAGDENLVEEEDDGVDEVEESYPTRKHFQATADLLKAIPDKEKRKELALHHAHLFSKQNPRFDHARFLRASNAHEGVDEDIGQGAPANKTGAGVKNSERPIGGLAKKKKQAMAKSVGGAGIIGESVDEIPEATGMRARIRKVLRDQVDVQPKARN
jgi:hypothetical protein